MSKTTRVETAKSVPPATNEAPVLSFRAPPRLTAALDKWIADQPAPRPSRPEAIRRLLGSKLGLAVDAGSIEAEDLNASNDE